MLRETATGRQNAGPTTGSTEPVRIATLDGRGREASIGVVRSVERALAGHRPEFTRLPGGLDGLGAAARPDIALIDAASPDEEWTSTASRISARFGCEVVALAARGETALVAFDMGCADCVLQPVHPERLRMALRRATALRDCRAALATRNRSDGWRIELPDRNGGRSVAMRDVVRIEAARDYALIHAQSRVHIVRATMAELERALPHPLIRVHRSAMVSLAHVSGWGPPARGRRTLSLSDGFRVPVGPGYVAAARQAFRRWLDTGPS